MRQMQVSKNENEQLLQKVYLYGFAVDDVLLFLDTHPDDCEARAYFQRMRDAYQEARADYVQNVRPLAVTDVNADSYWTWAEGPWPWEGGVC